MLVPLARWAGWSRQRLGALLLVAGWGNTSFVGLPMIEAYYGEQWVPLGLFLDLCGSYLGLSIVGISIATLRSDERVDVRGIVRPIVAFPPFLALVVALATNHLTRPDWLDGILRTLSGTMAPIALAAVGYAIDVRSVRAQAAPLAVGLGFRLVVAPLVWWGC
jgi:predicted permease